MQRAYKKSSEISKWQISYVAMRFDARVIGGNDQLICILQVFLFYKEFIITAYHTQIIVVLLLQTLPS